MTSQEIFNSTEDQLDKICEKEKFVLCTKIIPGASIAYPRRRHRKIHNLKQVKRKLTQDLRWFQAQEKRLKITSREGP